MTTTAGAREVRVRVQVYQRTEDGLRRLQEGVAEAKGDKTPGMAIPVGVGGAAGRAAVSAVVSGGLNLASETTGQVRRWRRTPQPSRQGKTTQSASTIGPFRW